jgi:hypothetical protein
MIRTKKTKTTFVVIVLILVAGFASVVASKQVSARDAVGYFTQPELEDVDLTTQLDQTTINNITFRLVAARQNGENFQVDLCFTLPDSRDWLIADRGDEVILSVRDKTYFPVEEGTINWISSPDGTKKIERCEYLLFPVIVGKETGVVKLTLQQISISPPEALNCPAIQNKLDEASSGIKVQCNVGNGRSGVEILEKPSNLTEPDARNMVHEIIIDARPGPWEFDIKVPAP